MNQNTVIIHTDGACRGNPGIGAWAATLEYNSACKEISGVVEHTTNNQMELLAVIEAIKSLKKQITVILYTNSTYVLKGIKEWIINWRKTGFKKIKNVELWQELDVLAQAHTITWHWVRGHNGHPGNERVDLLANIAIDNYLIKENNQDE